MSSALANRGRTRILGAQRCYEFGTDELRLTLLSQQQVIELVRNQFEFQGANVISPPPSFGEVLSTFPPGIVFLLGNSRFPDDEGTPIRSLNIEARRIVIDVAGVSAVIGPTFDAMREMLGFLRAADGSPAIGAPTRVLDYSELTVECPGLFDRLVSQRVASILSESSTNDEGGLGSMAFSLSAQYVPDGDEFPGLSPFRDRFNLEPRAGTKLGEGVLYSAAPLDTEAHIAMLDRLMEALG